MDPSIPNQHTGGQQPPALPVRTPMSQEVAGATFSDQGDTARLDNKSANDVIGPLVELANAFRGRGDTTNEIVQRQAALNICLKTTTLDVVQFARLSLALAIAYAAGGHMASADGTLSRATATLNNTSVSKTGDIDEARQILADGATAILAQAARGQDIEPTEEDE